MQTPRTQKTLTVAVVVLLVAAITFGALGVYASQRMHGPCPSGYAIDTSRILPYGTKANCVSDTRHPSSISQGSYGFDGPLVYNSRWYWFYAAGAAGAAMLVAMFLITVHPSRQKGRRAETGSKGDSTTSD